MYTIVKPLFWNPQLFKVIHIKLIRREKTVLKHFCAWVLQIFFKAFICFSQFDVHCYLGIGFATTQFTLLNLYIGNI